KYGLTWNQKRKIEGTGENDNSRGRGRGRAPVSLNKKAPDRSGAFVKERQRLTLPGFIPVPSALVVLTALFGMGRGDSHRYSRPKIGRQSQGQMQLMCNCPRALSLKSLTSVRKSRSSTHRGFTRKHAGN